MTAHFIDKAHISPHVRRERTHRKGVWVGGWACTCVCCGKHEGRGTVVNRVISYNSTHQVFPLLGPSLVVRSALLAKLVLKTLSNNILFLYGAEYYGKLWKLGLESFFSITLLSVLKISRKIIM